MTDQSERRAQDSALLGFASVGAGLAAYGFVVVGTRAYGSDAFASVAQVWTIWFMSAAVLTFPLQHWIINTSTVDGGLGRVRQALPLLTTVILAAAAVLGAGSAVLGDTLFSSRSPAYPIAVFGVTAGAGLLGVLRGSLAARGRYRSAGLAIAGENIVRLVLGVVVAAAGGSVEVYGLMVASGMIIAVAWPSAWRFGRPAAGPRAPVAQILSGLGGGNLIAQAVLTSGPILLALLGGSAEEVTALFVTLSLMRAPYLVALGVSVRATAALSNPASERTDAVTRRWRWLLVGTGTAAAVAALGAAIVGPAVVRAIFGSDIALGRGAAAAIAFGSVVAVGNLGASLLVLVAGRTRRVLGAWLTAAASGAIAMAVASGSTPRVVAGFVVAEAVALGVMAGRRATLRGSTR